MKRPTREPDTKRILKLLEELESEAKYVERFAIKAGEKVFFVRGLTKIVRASLHYYNDKQEIERFCQALPLVR